MLERLKLFHRSFEDLIVLKWLSNARKKGLYLHKDTPFPTNLQDYDECAVDAIRAYILLTIGEREELYAGFCKLYEVEKSPEDLMDTPNQQRG